MNHFFKKSNHHSDGCGKPPMIEDKTDESGLVSMSACGLEDISYTGYFENEHGEQSVILYDRKAKKGVLVAGDMDWDNAMGFSQLESIKNIPMGGHSFCNMVLGPDEALWLGACLLTIKRND